MYKLFFTVDGDLLRKLGMKENNFMAAEFGIIGKRPEEINDKVGTLQT